jgi:hypothetical protein
MTTSSSERLPRMPRFLPCFAAALAMVSAAAGRSEAGFVLTAEDAGVQESQVAGVTTEDFDGFPLGAQPAGTVSAVGTFSAGLVVEAANVFGGAGRVGQFFSTGGQTTLTLFAPQAYFGFWWSAADPTNLVEFFSGGNLVASFEPGVALAALGAAYFGNPNPPGGNNSEKYAYLNFIGTDGSMFDQITFTSPNFEADNFSLLATTPSIIPGTVIDGAVVSVPEPSSVVLMGAGVAGMLGYGWRRRKAAKAV